MPKVAMLLSGGVDSSVALARLVASGEHDITAYYLKIWLEDELAYLGDCPWEEDLRYATAVAQQLGVSLHVVPLQTEYHARVVEYVLSEARAGRTPNPDIFCNSLVKFGAFNETVGKDYDYIATGHYARVDHSTTPPQLLRAADPIKDQTYFLSRLSPVQLSRALFPIGGMDKSDLRAEAARLGLPTATRPDSQGICFLGQIPYGDFLAHHLGTQLGDIVEQSTGKVLGTHQGHYRYTLGQRQNLRINGGPWYVVAKDVATNTVYVAHGSNIDERLVSTVTLTELSWLTDSLPTVGEVLQVKLRHGPGERSATLGAFDGSTMTLDLSESEKGVASGQFVALYRGEQCLGSGMVTLK